MAKREKKAAQKAERIVLESPDAIAGSREKLVAKAKANTARHLQ